MAISKEEIEHLKDLARVEFEKEETEKLANDLAEILNYIDQLKELDISGAHETTYALEGVKNVFRADAPAESPANAGAAELNKQDTNEYANVMELIDAFPEKYDPAGGEKGDYLKVKPVL